MLGQVTILAVYLLLYPFNVTCNKALNRVKQGVLMPYPFSYSTFGYGSPVSQCMQQLDVGLLVDESGSITKEQWNSLIPFLKEIATSLSLDKNDVRLALVTYSTTVRLFIDFLNPASRDEKLTLETIDRLSQSRIDGGHTYTGEALRYMITSIFAYSRKNIPKILILITDGRSSEINTTGQYAAKMRRLGYTVMVVGVGESIEYECRGIVGCITMTERCPLYIKTNWKEMHGLVASFMKEVCTTVAKDAVCEPIWSEWSGCDAPCGIPGTRTRPLMEMRTLTNAIAGSNGKMGLSCKDQIAGLTSPLESCFVECVKAPSYDLRPPPKIEWNNGFVGPYDAGTKEAKEYLEQRKKDEEEYRKRIEKEGIELRKRQEREQEEARLKQQQEEVRKRQEREQEEARLKEQQEDEDRIKREREQEQDGRNGEIEEDNGKVDDAEINPENPEDSADQVETPQVSGEDDSTGKDDNPKPNPEASDAQENPDDNGENATTTDENGKPVAKGDNIEVKQTTEVDQEPLDVVEVDQDKDRSKSGDKDSGMKKEEKDDPFSKHSTLVTPHGQKPSTGSVTSMIKDQDAVLKQIREKAKIEGVNNISIKPSASQDNTAKKDESNSQDGDASGTSGTSYGPKIAGGAVFVALLLAAGGGYIIYKRKQNTFDRPPEDGEFGPIGNGDYKPQQVENYTVAEVDNDAIIAPCRHLAMSLLVPKRRAGNDVVSSPVSLVRSLVLTRDAKIEPVAESPKSRLLEYLCNQQRKHYENLLIPAIQEYKGEERVKESATSFEFALSTLEKPIECAIMATAVPGTVLVRPSGTCDYYISVEALNSTTHKSPGSLAMLFPGSNITSLEPLYRHASSLTIFLSNIGRSTVDVVVWTG
ncbi:bifunctional Thrombospondin type-1 (TSP1) repeat superfamily/von Willebrand factor A-like domain superfamily/von Willebrand factor [Babesia duncani]|uniref:Bifunctional Thrombospondin type-1 (TSP1) repeat superfamily/von Willebrand factor A-like domain superfamily/von Willebrand factor n=1 Tax=Babesia duncani TaxID=323732 RepID=A0AAD9PNX5_9APIC|nr:bifunctional Thrombospondin type-1 (TSP1) repeat superfamily/von Willebrand factor A-like domain superfamily/von Willebrand factor [Babesia duncani]